MPRASQAIEDAAAAYRRHMEETSTQRMMDNAAAVLRRSTRPREEEVEVEVDAAPAVSVPSRWRLRAALPALPAPRDDRADHECSVCLQAIEDELALPCGHAYCGPCVEAALRKKAECPLCRRDMAAFSAARGIETAADEREPPRAFGRRRRPPESSDVPVIVRAGHFERGNMVVFFVRVDGRCRFGDALFRKVSFQFKNAAGDEQEIVLNAAPFELPLPRPEGAAPAEVLATVHPRPGLGVDRTPQFVPLSSATFAGTVLALKSEWAAAAAGRVRRSRARVHSDPGSMTETLTQLDTLRRTNIETHRSLTGTVERIRGQANNIRAQLRESRRTPSLADIVALNNAALGR